MSVQVRLAPKCFPATTYIARTWACATGFGTRVPTAVHGLGGRKRENRNIAGEQVRDKFLALGITGRSLLPYSGIPRVTGVGAEVIAILAGIASGLGGRVVLEGEWGKVGCSGGGQMIREGHGQHIGRVGLVLEFRGAVRSAG